eukprot:4897044-Alexandrium_andersonii.AAC.1
MAAVCSFVAALASAGPVVVAVAEVVADVTDAAGPCSVATLAGAWPVAAVSRADGGSGESMASPAGACATAAGGSSGA